MFLPERPGLKTHEAPAHVTQDAGWLSKADPLRSMTPTPLLQSEVIQESFQVSAAW